MFKESQVEIHDLQTKIAKLERANEKLKAANVSTGAATTHAQGGSTEVQAAITKAPLPPGFKDVTTAKKGTKRKQDEAKVSATTKPAKKIAGKNEQTTSVLVDDNLIDDLGIFDVPGAGRISTRIMITMNNRKIQAQQQFSTSTAPTNSFNKSNPIHKIWHTTSHKQHPISLPTFPRSQLRSKRTYLMLQPCQINDSEHNSSQSRLQKPTQNSRVSSVLQEGHS